MSETSKVKFSEEMVIFFGKDKEGRPTGKENNPKRSGSRAAKQFDLYEDQMTVGEYLKAGGSRASINWDYKKGYIELVNPSSMEEEEEELDSSEDGEEGEP